MKPSKVYFVSLKGAKLPYGQRGGGLFSTYHAAQGRADTIEQRGGGKATIFEATVDWELMFPDDEDDE